MCNRYTPPRADRIYETWRVNPKGTYKDLIVPRAPGPFVTPGACEVGQWGLIPPYSAVRNAISREGRPLSTNNCRMETMHSSPVFRLAWQRSQRCLIPAESWDEPYWGTGKNIWWRFARGDGLPWALAGLWEIWTDRQTGEVLHSYTMITQPAAEHPVLSKMHRPGKEKRAVVPLEPDDWDVWLNGEPEQARALIRLPSVEMLAHAAVDPVQQVDLA